VADKLLELLNDDGNVVIDEQFNVPMLIAKGTVRCSRDNKLTAPPGYSFFEYFARCAWYGSTILLEAPPSAFGNMYAGVTTDAGMTAINLQFMENFIVAARCVQGGYAWLAGAALGWRPSDGKVVLAISAQCELQNGDVEVVVYKSEGLKAERETLAIFDPEGKLRFDVRKPPMMFLGSLYGGVNVWQYEAARYEMDIPADIDPAHCFITAKSGAPFYSAYKIHSGGVTFGSTMFKSIMTFPVPGKLRVQLIRVNSVDGSSGAYGFGGYFENVIYCPYPSGVYIDFSLY